jgi:diguanylate cyclase (GGDEF)-like protein
LGLDYLQVCERAARDGEPEAAEAGELVRAALRGAETDRRVCYQGEDSRWFAMQAVPIDGRDSGSLVIHLDITTHRADEDRWRHRALHDALTGLPNRALLLDRLDHAVSSAARNPHSLAVLFVDLDAFKSVNDDHGHAAGDQVLQQAARRMADSLRAGDTIGRWGGDEFLVIAERLEHPTAGEELAQRLKASLHDPVQVGSDVLTIAASVGVAHFDEHLTRDQLIDAADQALQELRRDRPKRQRAVARQLLAALPPPPTTQ